MNDPRKQPRTAGTAERAGSSPLVCLVQPPFVQLNSPYPAIFYLRSFLERRGFPVIARDHSIALFERIFCREGLKRIFEDAGTMAEGPPKVPDKGAGFDKGLRPVIERFLSEEELWLSSIDRLVNFLRGRDREWGHLLGLVNGAVPGGPRFDACLAALRGGPEADVSPDSAPLLASKLLADLAGFITAALDPGFSLIRYVPSAASPGAGFRNFSAVQAGLGGYVINAFYRPFLEEEWETLNGARASGGSLFLCLSIPFPGCLAGALTCADSAKKFFGNNAVTAAGGGYVNTELRFLEDEKIFDYFDYLSFDRGYGSLAAILEREAATGSARRRETPLYKTMYRSAAGGIIRDGDIAAPTEKSAVPDLTSGGDCYAQTDSEAVKSVFPDYSGVDFFRYICPVDDLNHMHRLWSDGRWIKAYLAHGCYWHNCAFCDVSLDYIRSFESLDAEALFRHLLDQAEKTGVRGIHFVDEACPPASLVRFALLNRGAGLPLVFWGNIRFEKNFTPDTAALLAAGGLIGVSAGIEVASEAGFRRIGKGINLRDVTRACAAFKEAGVLTHAYLIYGYWDEDDQEIIDSAETLRQLFAAGLLDSAFWHKFVLTKHSRIYAEKQHGLHPALEPGGDAGQKGGTARGRTDKIRTDSGSRLFALNDLSFTGEERFDKFTLPLDRLLSQWMAGDVSPPVQGVFPFRVPKPAVDSDLILRLLDEYARDRDRDRRLVPGTAETRALFLGSLPVTRTKGGTAQLVWRWRLGERRLRPDAPFDASRAEQLSSLLQAASKDGGPETADFYRKLESLLGKGAAKKAWKTLRDGGLVIRQEN
ncbi:MAG: radical SAM protein [Treponema sp.]|jgi:radical SAM superfamily enzyme YgiQ (UPF0313 family)|nr:radical SAM protein [Treponema sp.]